MEEGTDGDDVLALGAMVRDCRVGYRGTRGLRQGPGTGATRPNMPPGTMARCLEGNR